MPRRNAGLAHAGTVSAHQIQASADPRSDVEQITGTVGTVAASGTGSAPLRATGADVVMLTAETRRTVRSACLEEGAAGWIGKDAFLDEVVAALNDVLAGTPLIGCTAREAMIDELRIERAGLRKALTPFEQLTMRERDVLAALVDGLSAEEIAETQYVALTTVRSQIRAVLQKLGVRSQLAAVAHANRVGWKPERRRARRRVSADSRPSRRHFVKCEEARSAPVPHSERLSRRRRPHEENSR